jgi:hypothetical protein
LFALLAILLSSIPLYFIASLFPDHFFVGEEEKQLGFWTYVYFTATTLSTVGYGDFLPRNSFTGFAFLMVTFALMQFAPVSSRIVVEQWLGFEVEETVPEVSDEESALPN